MSLPEISPAVTDERPLTDVCFENFGLHPLLLQGLEEAGFVRCTPIQALTLPLALAGRDVAGQAQTGTGKTLAFLVTIINRLLTTPAHPQRRGNDPRSVVLAPTRELAIQIEKDAHVIARHTGLRFALIYGGVDYDKQRELLRGGIDVVIATPGRLIDYVKQHQVVSMSGIDIVVLDEADRMFDLGFIKDIRFLLRRMPAREERQSMLFSATLSHRVLELAYEHMNEPEKLTAETETITAARVRQTVYFPANEEKLPLLLGLLGRIDDGRTMIFVNTKVFVEKVARALERAGYRVGVLSGDVPQPKREKLLAKFKKGELEILVATDVAARGLHIPDVSHVVNYDLPFDAEDYVHRIGRTARLGAEGDAISFACELYAISLPDIEKYIDQKIPVAAVDPELLKPVAHTPRALPPRADGEAAELHESIASAYAERVVRRDSGTRARPGSGPRPGGPRSGGPRSDRGPARGAESRTRSPRPPRDEMSRPAPLATPVVRADVPAIASVADATVDGAPKKRRRRGGRGRGRTAEAGIAVDATAGPRSRGAADTPSAERPARTKGAHAKPSGQGKSSHEHPRPAPHGDSRGPSKGLITRVAQSLKRWVSRFGSGPRPR
ncbi:MAG TPA: ATP-dependent RNA helicase RhlB [Candidatus Saccharimonadia bacterium]|nr:ATP-dependent RNA helicase RhlB [Candidatus Saccharimonadia bacterium]